MIRAIIVIIAGVLVLRTFEPTYDIVGFWPVLGEMFAIAVGLGLIGLGILGTASYLGGLSCGSR